MARIPELRRLDAALKRMDLDLMPLDSRLDHVESELRRATLETSPLFPRMDAAESEAARLARDSATAGMNLASLLTELEGVKAAVSGVSTKDWLTSRYRTNRRPYTPFVWTTPSPPLPPAMAQRLQRRTPPTRRVCCQMT